MQWFLRQLSLGFVWYAHYRLVLLSVLAETLDRRPSVTPLRSSLTPCQHGIRACVSRGGT